MKLIATHDSATGEKPTWWSAWTIPFARTQGKTIAEQYAAGCRSFDIRVRRVRGEWKCAHGLFVTKRTAYDIIAEIAMFGEECMACLTYEGGVEHTDEFKEFAVYVREAFKTIIWGPAAIKYGKDAKGVQVKYENVLSSQGRYTGGAQGFMPLDGRSWHTYLPIPWLWDRLYKRPHEFNNYIYTYVDFL